MIITIYHHYRWLRCREHKCVPIKNVDILLRIRHLRHRQTPIYLKRVKAHAIKRELQLSFLTNSFNFADLGIQESKSGYSSHMSFLYFSQPIGIFSFKGFNICYLLAMYCFTFSINDEVGTTFEAISASVTLKKQL